MPDNTFARFLSGTPLLLVPLGKGQPVPMDWMSIAVISVIAVVAVVVIVAFILKG